MKAYLLLILLLTSIVLFAQKDFFIKGSLKILSAGKGMSCGMQSSVNDFKQVKLVVNFKDTLYTLLSDSGTFEFPAIRKTDNFEIRFTYSSTNEYLIHRTRFFSIHHKRGHNEIQHKNEIGGPLLSTYKLQEDGKKTTLTMNYGLFCLLTEPYEPAGLKIYDFPITEQGLIEFHFPNRITAKTNELISGFTHLIPYFSFQLVSNELKPKYEGFYFLNCSVQTPEGSCKYNEISWSLPCNLEKVMGDIHYTLKEMDVEIKPATIGKTAYSRYFKPQILFQIDGKTIPKDEITSEPPTQLIFIVKNCTKEKITVAHNGHSGRYDVHLNAQEIQLKKNQQIELANLTFSLDNPKNYNAKIWLPEFPASLFSKITIYYGKKKLPLQLDLIWKAEQLHLKMIYTLEIKI
jgi:hypothetical protein